MRAAMLGGCILAMGVMSQGAAAQDMTACDRRLDEATQKIATLPIPSNERVRYLSMLVGAYERCQADQPDAWTQIDAYLEGK